MLLLSLSQAQGVAAGHSDVDGTILFIPDCPVMGGKKLSEDELKWVRKELEEIQVQFKNDRCLPKKKLVAALGAIVPVAKIPYVVNAPGNFCLIVEMDMSLGNERAVVTADFFRRQVRHKMRELVQSRALSPSVQPLQDVLRIAG